MNNLDGSDRGETIDNWRRIHYDLGAGFCVTRQPNLEALPPQSPEELSDQQSPEQLSDVAAVAGHVAAKQTVEHPVADGEEYYEQPADDQLPEVPDATSTKLEVSTTEAPPHVTDAAPGSPPIKPPDKISPKSGDAGDSDEGGKATPRTLREIGVTRFDDLGLTRANVSLAGFLGMVSRITENPAFPREVYVLLVDGYPVEEFIIRGVVKFPDGGRAHLDVGEASIGVFFTAADDQTSEYHSYAWEAGRGLIRTDIDLDFALTSNMTDQNGHPLTLEEIGERQVARYAELRGSGTQEDISEFPKWEVGDEQQQYVEELIKEAEPFAVTYRDLADLPVSRLEGSQPLPLDGEARGAATDYHQMLENHQATHGQETINHEEEIATLRVDFVPTEEGTSEVKVNLELRFDQLSDDERANVMILLRATPGMEPMLGNIKLVRTMQYVVVNGMLQISLSGSLMDGDAILSTFPAQMVNAGKRDVALLRTFLRNPRLTPPPRRRPKK